MTGLSPWVMEHIYRIDDRLTVKSKRIRAKLKYRFHLGDYTSLFALLFVSAFVVSGIRLSSTTRVELLFSRDLSI